MDLLTIYHKSPIFIQNVLTSLKGLQNKRERNGVFYQGYLKFLERFDYTDETWIQDYQEQQLPRLLQVAVTKSEFYKEFYQNSAVSEIKTVSDLQKLPILEKEIVRQNLEKIYTIDEKEGVVSLTSGTTGKPLKIIHTYEGLQMRNAFLDDFKRSHGFINGEMKKASFNSSQIIAEKQRQKIFWRDNFPLKQRLYSSYHTTEENLRYYVENLNEFQPDALDGYPSSLYEVARYINKYNIKLSFQPVAVFPTAEALLPHFRTEIEKAFNCRVFNQYASSEGAPFVTECTFGRLHYNMLSGVIEQDENNEMIITSFMNDGTPLIRYRIGDKIEFADEAETCACGSALPLVKELQGRTSDYILSSTNRKINSMSLSIIADDLHEYVVAMQVVQNKKNHVTLNIVPDEAYMNELDKKIKEKMIYFLGDEMSIDIQKVPEIEKDKSGKYKFVINNLVE